MTKDIIDYTALVDDAMHMIVKRSLEIFAGKEALGDHHFFISFITKYPGVIISEKLQKPAPCLTYRVCALHRSYIETLSKHGDIDKYPKTGFQTG